MDVHFRDDLDSINVETIFMVLVQEHERDSSFVRRSVLLHHPEW